MLFSRHSAHFSLRVNGLTGQVGGPRRKREDSRERLGGAVVSVIAMTKCWQVRRGPGENVKGIRTERGQVIYMHKDHTQD